MTTSHRGLYNRIRRDLQEIVLIESVECPQHVLPRRDFLLATTDRGELEVQEQAPELGGGFGGGGNAGDEEVVEFGVKGAVVGEASEFGRSVEGVGAGVAGSRVGAVVGAVAEVGAAGFGGDVAGARVDGCFVDGVVQAFDADVDDVGSEWERECLGCDLYAG